LEDRNAATFGGSAVFTLYRGKQASNRVGVYGAQARKAKQSHVWWPNPARLSKILTSERTGWDFLPMRWSAPLTA